MANKSKKSLADELLDICGEGDYVAFKRLGLNVPANVPIEAFEHLHKLEISLLKLVTCMNTQVCAETH